MINGNLSQPNKIIQQEIPLYFHHVSNDDEMVRKLVELGADIEKEFSDGVPPLNKSIEHDNLAITNILLERGAVIHPSTWSLVEGKHKLL